jgi:sugar lactone lactonase YvrE
LRINQEGRSQGRPSTFEKATPDKTRRLSFFKARLLMRRRKLIYFMMALVAVGGWGCKNNSTTSPNANHPIDFIVGGQLGSGFNDFNAPMGLCVDGSDNLYVADYGNNRVKQYNSNGVCLMTWSSGVASLTNVHAIINHPYGLALDSGGNILEVDNGGAQIQEFSTAGALLNQWGSAGTANGSFNDPLWIAVSPGGDIYVSDADNDRVQFFTGPGAFGGLLGSSCACSTLGRYYQSTTGIAFDASGNAYVGDLGNHRIEVFDSTGPPGAPVSTWGAGLFTSVDGMAFDRSGNLLAADDGARAILKFNSTGGLIEKWVPDTTAAPKDVAVDSKGAVWVSFQSSTGAFLTKFDH